MTANVKTNYLTVYDTFMTGSVVLVMSSCHDKDISNNVIFALTTERMTLNDSCTKPSYS